MNRSNEFQTNQEQLKSEFKIEVEKSPSFMNIAWDDFKVCPKIKSFLPIVQTHNDTIQYYKKLQKQLFPDIEQLLNETSDTKFSQSELSKKINSVYDSYNSDRFHEKPYLELNDTQVDLMEKSKLFGLYEQRFKFKEQQKYGLYNILETLS